MKRALVLCSVMTALGFGACGDSVEDPKPTPDAGGGDAGADGNDDGADGNDGAGDDGVETDSGTPGTTLDCTTLAKDYQTGCPDHIQISEDVSACATIAGGLTMEPVATQRMLAASICTQANKACDDLFTCFSDPDGLSASTRTAQVTGTATVEGDAFTFNDTKAWAVLGTKSSGAAGDLAVLFTHDGKPWYFKLQNFAERATQKPFLVDAENVIKLENFEDNVEIAVGQVTVTSFAVDGAFQVQAVATDADTGESIDLTVKGTFAK